LPARCRATRSSAQAERHLCIVYPMEVYRGRMPRRDLLDIGKTFDTERK
jgi:hypothetical protein